MVQERAFRSDDVYLAQVGRENRSRVVRVGKRGGYLQLAAIAKAAQRVGLLGSRDVAAVSCRRRGRWPGLQGYIVAGFRQVGLWFVLPVGWRALLRGALGGDGLPAYRLGYQNAGRASADGPEIERWEALAAAGLAVRCETCGRRRDGSAWFHVSPAGLAALDVPGDVSARAWPVACCVGAAVDGG